MGRRLVSGIFFAALLALLCWALIVGVFGRGTALSFPWSEGDVPADPAGDELLFDDDSTVDWSDPVTEVFDGSPEVTEPSGGSIPAVKPKTYEFAVNEDYLNALLGKFSGQVPIRNLQAAFGNGTVTLSGNAAVSGLAELLEIPAALVVFLPETVPCRLECVPDVCDGRLTVSVVRVAAGSDMIAPFLSDGSILSSVEQYLNGKLTEYLPEEYRMQSVTVSERGMYVRFSVE